MPDYNISLGVEVDTSNIQSQINTGIRNKIEPIKIDIDLDYTKKQINVIKSQILELNKVKVNLGTDIGSNSGVQQTTNEFKELLRIAKQIDGLNLRIKKLDANDNKNEIARLTSQLSVLEQAYQKLRGELSGKLPSGQLASVSASAIETADKLKQLDAQIADTKARLAKKIEIKLTTGKFATQIDEINRNADKLTNVPSELRDRISELNMQLNGMKTAAAKGDIDGLIESCKAYEAALESVRNQLKRNKIVEQNAFDKTALEQSKKSLSLEMDNWLRSNSAAAKQFGATIQQLKARIDACDQTQLDGLKREFQNVKKEAQLAGKNTQTFGDQLKSQFEKYKSYISVATLVMWAVQGLKDMFRQVVAIDSAMTELKKVTDETDASYNLFLNNAASRAKELGTTVEGLVASTADFARLGYGFGDSQGLAEVANIYAVVGDEINGVEDATKSLISTLAAFKDEASGISDTDFAMDIVDKFNEVSNNFAISSGGIGEALQRSASSMAAANNTLDESIALITAANTVVQDPDTVGRLMPTIKVAISVKLLRRTRPRKDFV